MKELASLPVTIRRRMRNVVDRLAQWPDVSGAKPLRHGLAGRYRIRIGDYRVQFTVRKDEITIEKVGHRSHFYEE